MTAALRLQVCNGWVHPRRRHYAPGGRLLYKCDKLAQSKGSRLHAGNIRAA